MEDLKEHNEEVHGESQQEIQKNITVEEEEKDVEKVISQELNQASLVTSEEEYKQKEIEVYSDEESFKLIGNGGETQRPFSPLMIEEQDNIEE